VHGHVLAPPDGLGLVGDRVSEEALALLEAPLERGELVGAGGDLLGDLVKLPEEVDVAYLLGRGFASFIGCPQCGQSMEFGVQWLVKGRMRPSLLAFSLMAFCVLPGSWEAISSMVLLG
jgi:hypothetical protein